MRQVDAANAAAGEADRKAADANARVDRAERDIGDLRRGKKNPFGL